MAPSKNNSDKLTRKRKALIDAKYHEAKSRRKLKEKERELDAQYTTLKAQRAIHDHVILRGRCPWSLCCLHPCRLLFLEGSIWLFRGMSTVGDRTTGYKSPRGKLSVRPIAL